MNNNQTKSQVKQPVPLGKVAKVPVVMQMERVECGAASLTMVLAYYGRWVPLEQVRKDCGVSRDGANALNIMRAARSYGLEAKAYRYTPERLKEVATFPCIVFVNRSHFVVVDGIKGDKVYLNDPARGTTTITMKEFESSYSRVCLLLQPGPDFEPGGNRKSVIPFIRERLSGGATVALAFLMMTAVIINLLGVLQPAFSRVLMDYLLTGRADQWVRPFLIIVAVFSVVRVGVQWIVDLHTLRINGKLAVSGNTQFQWKLLRLPMEFYSQRLAGDLQQRKESNATVAATIVRTLAPLALDTVMMIVYFIAMVRYSFLLALIGLLSIAINVAVSQYVSNKRVNLMRVMKRDLGKLMASTVSGIQMIETIKASGAENSWFEKWSGTQASVATQRAKYANVNLVLGAVPDLVNSISSIVIVSVGMFLCIQGEFTPGMIMAFQGFLTAFTLPASKLINAGQIIQEMRTDMERIQDVMDYPDDPLLVQAEQHRIEIESSGTTDDSEYSKLTGNVELKDVSFGYSLLDPPLIENFNLSLKTGSRVALVGGSGSGKSTVAKLISGLYQPWSGEITFDGRHHSEINRAAFCSSVAVVDQDITIFEDTIRNNITMWDKSIEEFEVILAARDAQLHSEIMDKPDGYNYHLLEGGKNLSGGQRQRLEIARVLAQDPSIIILDEATSALDAKTEQGVVESICARGITCIVVAHRLSTVRDCDEIIVLDHGKVVERGTHDELMALNGYYSNLVTSE